MHVGTKQSMHNSRDARSALLNSRTVGVVAAHNAGPAFIGLRCAGRSQVVVDQNPCDWPSTTHILCWHCAHPFGTPPVPKPTSYDMKLNRYNVRGCYCSWSCAAADCRSVKETGNLDRMFSTVHGQSKQITPAPPKYVLKAFGGQMSIEEFRGCQEEYRVVPPRLVVVEGINVQKSSTVRQRGNARVDFSRVNTTNEVLKLKRDKPLPHARGLISMHARKVG